MAKWMYVLGCVLLFLLVGCGASTPAPTATSQPTDTPLPTATMATQHQGGDWLVAPLTRVGDKLVYRGANLSNQVGWVMAHTYYSRTIRVALTWEGYENGASTWTITPEVMLEFPDWETNEDWTVDFWWPTERGPIPEGAFSGTSSK